jgi:hypothetical protein
LIDGIVTDDGVPAIDVQVGNQRWQAIIDTGFNGELELPERLPVCGRQVRGPDPVR